MLRKMFSYFTLPLLLLLSNSPEISRARTPEQNQKPETGILEKMIPSNGIVTMSLDLTRLGGDLSASKGLKEETLSFGVSPSSFFTVLVFDKVLRGPDLGSMELVPKNSPALPALLKASVNQLVIEKIDSSEPFDLMVRDGKTGFRFFNISGHSYDYDASKHVLNISDGRLLISNEFATKLGNASQSNSVAGKNFHHDDHVSDRSRQVGQWHGAIGGDASNAALCWNHPRTRCHRRRSPLRRAGQWQQWRLCRARSRDDVLQCRRRGSGLVCALPNNDHPVIPQNMYRMSGGTDNTERFEQIGQSWFKHAFTALTQNVLQLWL